MYRSCVVGLWSISCAAITLVGCNGESANDKDVSAVVDTQTAAVPDSSVTVKTVDKAGLEAAIKANAGKVVFVDFWATWCGPCVDQFPHTVELAKKYKDQGLAVISVSCDEASEKPEEQAEIEGKVRQFLQEQHADFENFLPAVGFDPFEAFDFKAIPYYLVYGRDGKLLKSYPEVEKSADADEIDAIVKEALAQPVADAAKS